MKNKETERQGMFIGEYYETDNGNLACEMKRINLNDEAAPFGVITVRKDELDFEECQCIKSLLSTLVCNLYKDRIIKRMADGA